MRKVGTTLARPGVYGPIVAAVISTVIALISLDMVGMRWDVPLTYSGDGLAVASHFKTVIESGWYEYQPALGAPYGQVYFDYPTADNMHFLVALILGAVWPSWGVVMNVHFLLGFPLAAITAAWLFRRLGISTPMTIALAVLFAIAPYHFIRAEGHLFLAWYWVVPLAVSLVLDVLRGAPLWGARPGMRRGLGHVLGRTGGTVAIAILVATCSAYYAVFMLVLGAAAAVVAVWLTHSWRRFAGAAAAAGATVVVLVINMAPDLIYRALNGANPGALQRTPVESEVYSLKLAQLLLPAPYHRFGPFNNLRTLYDEHYPLPSESPALGLIGAAGLFALFLAIVYLLGWVATRLGASSGRITTTPSSTALRLAPLAFVAFVAFMFSTVGGLETLVSFVTTALRSWNRMSVFIAVVSLAAVGILVDALVKWITPRLGDRKGLVAAVAVIPALLLLAIGIWDQTPPRDAAARAAAVASFDSDAQFAADLDEELDDDAMVFELPFMDFPESPPTNNVLDTDQLRLFLHSDDLRVSGGGIRGREDIDSIGEIADLPAEEFVDAAAERGYEGVVVDTYGYTTDVVLDSLKDAADGTEIVSPDGRFVYLGF